MLGLGAIPIVGELVGLGKTYLEGRNVTSKARAEAEAKVLVTAATSVADWEKITAKSADKSWKDEAWTVTFIAIIVACFIPPLQPHVKAGFEFLSDAPTWFQAAVGASIAASFGVRGLDKALKLKRK